MLTFSQVSSSLRHVESRQLKYFRSLSKFQVVSCHEKFQTSDRINNVRLNLSHDNFHSMTGHQNTIILLKISFLLRSSLQ